MPKVHTKKFVTFEDLEVAWMLLVTGLSLSLIVFILEVLSSRSRRFFNIFRRFGAFD